MENIDVDKSKQFEKRLTLVFLLILGGVTVFAISTILITMPLTNKTRVLGLGAYPLLISSALLIMIIWNLTEVLTGKGSGAVLAKSVNKEATYKSLRLLLLIMFSAVLLPFLGFIGSFMVFTYIQMTFFAKPRVESGIKRIIYAVLVPIVIFSFFYYLGVYLPNPYWWPF